MSLSITLAKIIGPIYLIVATGIFLRTGHYKRIIMAVCKNEVLLYIAGLAAMVVGMSIVVVHNVWIMRWPVILTILGWLSLSKGILILLFPEGMAKQAKILAKNEAVIIFAGSMSLIIGLFFTAMGYIK